MNPKGTSAALAEMNKDSTRVQDTHDEANIERRKSRENKPRLIDVDDDSLPTNLRESTPKKSTEPEERKSPKLDGPESNGAPQRPGAVGRVS